MRIAMMCFTDQGCATALRIAACLNEEERPQIWCKKKDYVPPEGILAWEDPLRRWTEEQFGCRDALIFVGAVGIAVRSIAPFLKSKTKDPAVLAADEQGRFVISLVSGHIGGANELCERIAEAVGAIPVITTATDLSGKFAVDVFARKNDLWISDMTAAKRISAALLDGQRIGFYSDLPVEGRLPAGLVRLPGPEENAEMESRGAEQESRNAGMESRGAGQESRNAGMESRGVDQESRNTEIENPSADQENHGADQEGVCGAADRPDWMIYVSVKEPAPGKERILWLAPRRVVLGLGCRRGKTAQELEAFVLSALREARISPRALKRVCSIDVKAEEPGILELCERYGLPFTVYTAEELMRVPGQFQPSAFVEKQVGADNVCERSAVLGSGNGALLMGKKAGCGMTAAAALENRRISFG